MSCFLRPVSSQAAGPEFLVDEFLGAPHIERTFSWQRAVYNREHHTIAGLLGGLSLLAGKMYF